MCGLITVADGWSTYYGVFTPEYLLRGTYSKVLAVEYLLWGTYSIDVEAVVSLCCSHLCEFISEYKKCSFTRVKCHQSVVVTVVVTLLLSL